MAGGILARLSGFASKISSHSGRGEAHRLGARGEHARNGFGRKVFLLFRFEESSSMAEKSPIERADDIFRELPDKKGQWENAITLPFTRAYTEAYGRYQKK
jgi:hypothetical protein